MAPPPPPPFISLLLLLIICHSSPPAAAEQLSSFSAADSPWLPLQDRILVSPNQTFAAGFRTSASTAGRFFFAVWVRSSLDKTIVWSLQGDVYNSSALTISPAGSLSLNNTSGSNLWADVSATNASSLVLQENGELRFGNWSSFSIPTDTILANQAVKAAGTTLQSGRFQLVNATALVFNGTDSYWGTPAPIVNLTADGTLQLKDNNQLIASDRGYAGKVVLRRLTLNPDGNLRLYSLHDGRWRVVWQLVLELCAIHGTCGTNAICVPVGANATRCECPPGYRSIGGGNSCELKQQFSPGGKFLRMDFVSFSQKWGPDATDMTPLNLQECESSCLGNSSCIGFSYKFDGKRNCTHHSNRLTNGEWSPGSEMATFVRVASSEADRSDFSGMTSMMDTVCPVRIGLPVPPKGSKTTVRNATIISALFALELLAGVLSFWAFLRKYSKYRDMARTLGMEYMPNGGPKRFSYAELKAATNDFSNLVGRGGYGEVYKGELPDRRVIAVKRLKNISGGEAEFWAEVTIIARMHHLNLVRLWGFCAEKDQRMLVYEYVPNGSLDKFLFAQPSLADQTSSDGTLDDPSKELIPPKPILDWNIRYRIALGVARAIAYLHEECLEWVLHCDIKPENILLEDDYCPKVSDFGLSKLTTKKDRVTMSRIRGTRGYMAPEWVIQREPITAKADVYSFGVVLLELVSGMRTSVFQRSSLDSEDWFMPKWAFEKVYVENRVEDILDRHILDSYDNREHFELVDRMVKTAMWCLQDRADLRPSMGKVAKMLEGTVEITEPGKPSIFCVS